MTRRPWHHVIERPDWAAMTRAHESAHVTASEALGIPVTDVWANPERDAVHGGHYNNGPGDSQLQSVIYLIGAEGGAQELRDRGYDESVARLSVDNLGGSDRARVGNVVRDAAAMGWRLAPERAYQDALDILHSPDFRATAQNVAEALADRGDRLTGADIRAAMGDFELDGSLWVPTAVDLRAAEPGCEYAASVSVGASEDIEREEEEIDL